MNAIVIQPGQTITLQAGETYAIAGTNAVFRVVEGRVHSEGRGRPVPKLDIVATAGPSAPE